MTDKKEYEYDLNRDGKIDSIEQQTVERKLKSQRRIAIAAMGGIVFFPYFMATSLMFNFLQESDISVLADISGLYYVVLGGVVSAYMGVEAWLHKR